MHIKIYLCLFLMSLVNFIPLHSRSLENGHLRVNVTYSPLSFGSTKFPIDQYTPPPFVVVNDGSVIDRSRRRFPN